MKAPLSVLLIFLLEVITTTLVAKTYNQTAINTRAQKMINLMKANGSKLN